MIPLITQLAHTLLQTTSEGDSTWLLLLIGPAGAVGVYWAIYQYSRNTDKSHSFEQETLVEAQPIKGSDLKVNKVTGTKRKRIQGENTTDHRERVRRID